MLPPPPFTIEGMADNPPPVRSLLAYENPHLLNSPDARLLRIAAEYLEPQSRLRRENIQDTIVFFGSARIHGSDSAVPADHPQARGLARYYDDARELARRLTLWADPLPSRRRRFVITSGGGPGIMEAANRGAADAGGKTIGFNIRLPFEQHPNPFISPALNFEFHYFFMRKFWFAYPAKALVAFPGGFGTLDELMEMLTLVQTRKLNKKIVILLYGRSYWEEIINFKALVEWGTISASDLELFQTADSPQEAYDLLTTALDALYLKSTAPAPPEDESPAIARTLG
jgi:uncharacterized protein (TIGR00730 family)